jgi:RNA polymerase sigma factor (sigma-70 family)
MTNFTDPASANPGSDADHAYHAYKSGNSAPLYQAFVAQARIAVWKNIGPADPTLCHQIAERGLLAVGKFRGDSRVSTWFYKIAENECKRELRRLTTIRKRDVALDSLGPGSKDSRKLGNDAERAFKASMIALEAASRLRGAISVLPGDQREAVLQRLRGVPFKEIAASAGVPLATIASRFRLGMEKLEKNLSKSDKKWLRKGLIL